MATWKAVEGFDVQDHVQALLYSDVDERFIRGIQEATTPQLCYTLGNEAKKFAEQYDWHMIVNRIKSTLSKANLVISLSRVSFSIVSSLFRSSSIISARGL